MAGGLVAANTARKLIPTIKNWFCPFTGKTDIEKRQLYPIVCPTDPIKKDMYLDITIEEGPLYRFGAVSWSGNEKITDAGFSHFIVVDSGRGL